MNIDSLGETATRAGKTLRSIDLFVGKVPRVLILSHRIRRAESSGNTAASNFRDLKLKEGRHWSQAAPLVLGLQLRSIVKEEGSVVVNGSNRARVKAALKQTQNPELAVRSKD